jgi:drug/metabolite transporter (DMT)-like permease
MSLESIRLLSATPAGIATTSEVAFAFIVAWVWLNETLDVFQLVGAGMVLIGIAVAQTARREAAPVYADLALETGPIVLPDIEHEESERA